MSPVSPRRERADRTAPAADPVPATSAATPAWSDDAGSPEDPAPLQAALGELAALCGSGHFEAALRHIADNAALQSSLRAAERQSIEALIRACSACEDEAQRHRRSLERAVAREQTLGRHLLECSDRLVDAHRRPAPLSSPLSVPPSPPGERPDEAV